MLPAELELAMPRLPQGLLRGRRSRMAGAGFAERRGCGGGGERNAARPRELVQAEGRVPMHSCPRGLDQHAVRWRLQCSRARSSGGHPFYWHRSGDTYTPGFAEQGVNANLFLNRTLWINHLLDLTPPSFVVHEGCEVNRPDSGTVVPYAGPRYARFQNAGRILVCNNALAIVSRAKVFYDGLSPLPQAFELASSWSSAAQPSPEHDAGVLPIRAFGGLPR